VPCSGVSFERIVERSRYHGRNPQPLNPGNKKLHLGDTLTDIIKLIKGVVDHTLTTQLVMSASKSSHYFASPYSSNRAPTKITLWICEISYVQNANIWP